MTTGLWQRIAAVRDLPIRFLWVAGVTLSPGVSSNQQKPQDPEA